MARASSLLSLLLFSSLIVFAVCDDAVATEQGSIVGFTPEQLEQMEKAANTLQFQAETNRLMDILINSLYSNRDIFLRELISNASDALDKIRFLALTNKKLMEDNPNLDIHVSFDKDQKVLVIRDTGIGMTKEDLVKHLGTVASSGTTQFLEAAAKGAEPLKLIGQFGVGFYSVYLVADKVTVVSKHPNGTQAVWQSTANSVFSVVDDPRGNTLGRGTQIILHMKDDALEYLEQDTLTKITDKYSKFIDFPIYLNTTKTVTEEVPVEESEAKSESAEETKKDEEDVEVKDEEDADKKEDKPKTKTVSKTVAEWKIVNEHKAIWTRNPKNVTEEEYQDFYKSLTKDESGSITHLHFNAEGEISFRSILYVPKTAPFDLYDKYYGKNQSLKLYVRRVLISEEFEDFMPRYLNFIRGVVDSEDLPLNVSRETLSKSKVLKVMAKKLTRKALEMLKKLADKGEKKGKDDEEDEKEEKADDAADEKKDEKSDDVAKEQYSEFFKNFGKSIKLGVIEDHANKNKLVRLLRYVSSKSDGKLISLQTYIDRMKPKQKQIYYLTGESVAAIKNSPFLERLTKRGYEVLFMTDPLDEYVMQNLPEFDSKKFASASKEGLKFDDETEATKAKAKAQEEEYKPLAEWLKKVYGEKVEKVTVSNRIATSPCVLVTSQWGWSANMERIMRAQAFSDAEKQAYMMSKKTMEINPRHPVIKDLKDKVAAFSDEEKETAPAQVKDVANLMYDTALLTSGFTLGDLNEFQSRMARVLAQNLGVDPNAQVEDEPEPEPEPESESKSDDAEGDSDNSETKADDAPAQEEPEDKVEL